MNNNSNDLARYKHLIGKAISAIPREELPDKHRVVPEGGMITMDFRPERVNLFLDSQGGQRVEQGTP
ncbi:hypothetical protein DFJ73DRAFT_920859 [Zopfochytrium polystomum]|nr:hypothetical protein DFJ73DRAFT_920859 [Zopfochytrium polystomum]